MVCYTIHTPPMTRLALKIRGESFLEIADRRVSCCVASMCCASFSTVMVAELLTGNSRNLNGIARRKG